MPFKDKVIWITGASSGYGAEMARAFSQEGAKLILSARREQKLTGLAEALNQAAILPLDLTNIDSFREKTAQALAAFGRIDYLIHNGALAQNAPVMETTLAVERQLMEVDYFSHTELTRCVLPHMLARNSGHIVAVSGLLAYIHLPGRATYAAAKAALIAYFGCLRAELVHTGIHVTVLVPGLMQTALANKAIRADGKPAPASAAETPSPAGCPLTEAAAQTLQAIAEQQTQTYIGLEDQSYQLWKLTMNQPAQDIQTLLDQLRHEKRQ